MAKTEFTRSEQAPETIYIANDGQAFFTPDGEGRVWFDSAIEAQFAYGDDIDIVLLDPDTEIVDW